MKTKLELLEVASELAKSLIGEQNLRKIQQAQLQKFNSLELHDDDFTTFQNMVYENKARFEGLNNQLLATEMVRLRAAQAATKPA